MNTQNNKAVSLTPEEKIELRRDMLESSAYARKELARRKKIKEQKEQPVTINSIAKDSFR